MAKTEPTKAILDILQTNWNNANTSISSDPSFHTGRYNQDASNPQVSVTDINATTIGGSPSGYAAFDPSGAGAIQEYDGGVDVGLWSDYSVADVNPKKLTWEFREEVMRIVQANQTTVTDLRYVAGGQHRLIVETEKTPAVYHRIQEVVYGYAERP